MTRLANELRCIRAMSDASTDLMLAAVHLASAGDLIGADCARRAASKLLDDCHAACDYSLSRWSSRLILLIGRILGASA